MGQLRSGGVKDHLHRAVIPGQHHARHSGLAGDVDGRTAPHHQPPLDGDVVHGKLPFPQAVGKDQVAFKNGVVDICLAPYQHSVPVGPGYLAGIIHALENVAHDLGHLPAGDIAFGMQAAIAVPVDIAALHHGRHGVYGPCAHIVSIREPGQG